MAQPDDYLKGVFVAKLHILVVYDIVDQTCDLRWAFASHRPVWDVRVPAKSLGDAE